MKDFGYFGRHFPCATSAKILVHVMYSRVPQAIAQIWSKNRKLSHIMGTAPILEMVRVYGLLARLWLLDKMHKMIYRPKFARWRQIG